jgi:hypothetical protein
LGKGGKKVADSSNGGGYRDAKAESFLMQIDKCLDVLIDIDSRSGVKLATAGFILAVVIGTLAEESV